MENYSPAILTKQEVPNQQFIVNGVPQKAFAYVVNCNHCGRVIAQYNPGDPLKAVIQHARNVLAKDMVYCPTCGYKLGYYMDIIDANQTPVETTQNQEEASQ